MLNVKDTLPDKLSALIRVSLGDLAKAEADKENYVVEMGCWHEPYSGNGEQCAVCLAGAVMAFTFGLPKDDDITLFDFEGDGDGSVEGSPLMNKLEALDNVRCGQVRRALSRLGELAVPAGIDAPDDFVNYHENPAAWRVCMNAIADRLEAAGL